MQTSTGVGPLLDLASYGPDAISKHAIFEQGCAATQSKPTSQRGGARAESRRVAVHIGLVGVVLAALLSRLFAVDSVPRSSASASLASVHTRRVALALSTPPSMPRVAGSARRRATPNRRHHAGNSITSSPSATSGAAPPSPPSASSAAVALDDTRGRVDVTADPRADSTPDPAVPDRPVNLTVDAPSASADTLSERGAALAQIPISDTATAVSSTTTTATTTAATDPGTTTSATDPGTTTSATDLGDHDRGDRPGHHDPGHHDPGSPYRNPFRWPFAGDSPWNTPVGSAARFASSDDPRNVDLNADGANINAAYWSVPVFLASPSDPVRAVSNPQGPASYRMPIGAAPSNDSDAVLAIVDPTKSVIDETWMTASDGNGGFDAALHLRTDLRGDGMSGLTAASASGIAGLIRTWEVRSGSIRHALAFALPRERLKVGWVWPARSEDNGSESTYLGSVPMGSFFAIPSSVDLNALGLSPDRLVFARAMQLYGAYVINASSQFTLYAEPSADSLLGDMRGDLSRIRAQLRVVTNNGPTSVGGGGTPLASLAPPMSPPLASTQP